MRVLITRPLRLAKELEAKLERHGMVIESFPTIEIMPTPFQNELSHAIDNLHSTDFAIFTSRFAAHYTMEILYQRWKNPSSELSHLQFAAIGPGTSLVIQQAGIQNVLSPKVPPFESESLIALPEFQSVKNNRITVFRGNGGRELLQKTLENRGAKLTMVECYQRKRPTISTTERETLLKAWQNQPLDAIITTSQTGLTHLKYMVGEAGWDFIRQIPFVVISKRMETLAKEFNVKTTILAEGASDILLLKALDTIRFKEYQKE